jgi:ABC-type glycerol-3-phosphate transport system substrate-binding protein
MKRHVTLLIVLALFCAAVAIPTSARAQDKTLTVWVTGGDDDATVFQAVADVWTAKSGIKVTATAVSWSDVGAKNLAAIAGKEGPDIYTGGLSMGIQLGAKGGVVDLAKAYAKDVAELQKVANKGTWDSIVDVSGALYGVPYDLTIQLLLYRPDILEAAGIKAAPQTWDELVTALKAVRKAAGDKGGMLSDWGQTSWLDFSTFLWQAGGNFYTPDCKSSIINDENGLKALEFYAALYKELGTPADPGDAATNFANGTYPLWLGGSWNAANLDTSKPEIKGKWEVVVLPAGPTGKRTAFIGGRVIGIMGYSKNADAAWDLIKFLYTEDGAKAAVAMAETKGATFFPPVNEYVKFNTKFSAKALEAIKSQLDDSQGPPNCPGFEEKNKEVTTQLQNVLLKDGDPQEALDASAAALDSGLTGE